MKFPIREYLSSQLELLALAIAGHPLPPLKEHFKVTLQVYQTDTPDGFPAGPVMCKENDLILDNFGALIAGLFYAYTSSVGAVINTVSMKDTGGTSRTFTVYSTVTTGGGASLLCYTGSTASMGARVGVGNNAAPTAPARTDSNLQTQVGSWTATSGPAATWTSAAGTVTFAGSVLISAGATITEAGVTINVRDNTSSTTTDRQVLLFHDTFSGVVIAAGKYAHVAYTIQL